LDDWEGGSRRPGAIFESVNRDEDIAIHPVITVWNLLESGITHQKKHAAGLRAAAACV